MQVNTIWIAPLARYTSLSPAEVRERLLGRAFFNIAAAGLIMRIYLGEEKGDLLRAVENYHSHSLALNHGYQARVLSSATRLFQK